MALESPSTAALREPLWAPTPARQVLLGLIALFTPLLLGLVFAHGLSHLDEAMAARERPPAVTD
jgi:hypothetical protein